MCLNKITVVSCVDHVARCDDNIRLGHALDAVQIFDISSDICAVDITDLTLFRVHNAQLATLGVDIVMTSGAEMLGQRTRFPAHINLDIINTTVTHIGDREIDDTISAEE